jgi:hypothetical protein
MVEKPVVVIIEALTGRYDDDNPSAWPDRRKHLAKRLEVSGNMFEEVRAHDGVSAP